MRYNIIQIENINNLSNIPEDQKFLIIFIKSLVRVIRTGLRIESSGPYSYIKNLRIDTHFFDISYCLDKSLISLDIYKVTKKIIKQKPTFEKVTYITISEKKILSFDLFGNMMLVLKYSNEINSSTNCEFYYFLKSFYLYVTECLGIRTYFSRLAEFSNIQEGICNFLKIENYLNQKYSKIIDH